jgi:arylsulfatase A
MKSRLNLFALICTALILASGISMAQTKPNIIFILADDFGLSDMGSSFGGIYDTPNLDSLASTGTRFDCAFGEPECAPSRGVLMTGQYPFRNGCYDQPTAGQVLPTEDGCVAQIMKQAGYATGVAGKWHQLTRLKTPAEAAVWGFDEFLVWPGNELRYHGAVLNRNGVEETVAYGPDSLNQFAIDFIRKHKSEPFFFYYPMISIHRMLEPTPDNPTAEGKQLYPDNIKYMDKLIGKLVAELETQGIRNNTIIVFAGDNGSDRVGTTYGRTIDGKKHSMLEGGSRVPLVVNWLGKPTSVRKDLVDFTDFLPTFAELAGQPLPSSRTFDGRSFAPQIKGLAGNPREWIYIEYNHEIENPAPEKYVRDPLWKLLDSGELYDMSDAPYVQTLVTTSSPAANAARAKLQAVLDSMVIGTPGNNPPTAVMTATPTSGFAPLVVSFNSSGSADADGSIVSRAWNFGDGGTGSGVSMSHTYSATGNYVATLTVTDDDGATSMDTVDITVSSVSSGPQVTVMLTDAMCSEAGSDIGKFKINRMGDTVSPLTVSYTLSGTAQNGVDFSTLSGTATIPSGASSAFVTVTPVNDGAIEGEESVILTLQPNASYTLGSSIKKTISLMDDEVSTVSIKATDSSASEAGDQGIITISRSTPTSASLVVNYEVKGAAKNGTDYQTIPSSVTIPAGMTSVQIVITPKEDSLVEGSEGVKLILMDGGTSYQIENSTGIVQIMDND